ncbi:efflux RND transporter permease subunit [Sphingopyxis granuli]|uniref:efflux RND transporter permease subunit n=1 Tax=Sphingopyxis granuli TaxID=267128 RepID=UPI001BB04D48|nr:efflux RND transporter permease subunit [Sphingopyxis granuli]QUM74623.1 efflux RND transporter permease subunit [Sphingopyxis granuli]
MPNVLTTDSLQSVRQVPLRGGDGRLLRVGDVATVNWAEAEQLHIARYNGKRALWVSVKQKDNVDTGSLRDALVQEVQSYRRNLPPDIAVSVAFDQSQDIAKKLNVLARDFAFALGLVLITLLPLGLRPSLIVMLSIPLSLALGVLALAMLGFTLNQISISGFILSLGILVDDSIVVTENIERHIRNGKAATEEAISATREIGAAVFGATGVLVFAFLPLAFLPEAAGDFVRGLPLAVILTVTASLLVSLTVIPFLASRILKPEHAHGNRFLVVVTSGIERFYAPVLHHALDHPRRWFWGAMTLCVASFGLVPVLGFSLFPAADVPYFLVRVEAPEGSSIEATDQAVTAVAAVVAKEPLVANVMENVGRGNPQIYYNLIPREGGTRYGELFVTLKDWPPQDGPALLRRLRERLTTFPDARVTVVNMENGPPLEAPVAVRISGPDLAVLKHLSDQVARTMKDVPGMRDVDNPIAFDRVDLDLGIDEARAGLLGIEPGEIRRAVRLAISGEQASSFRDAEGDSWPVTVRLPLVQSHPVAALGEVYVPRSDGESVPLSEVVAPRLDSTPAQITRLKLQRTVTVIGYNQPGTLTSTLNAETQARLAKIALPAGYALTAGGEAENAQRSFSGLGPIALLAVFGIFGVLVLEFGRFRETVVVIASVVPLGTFGGLIGGIAESGRKRTLSSPCIG